MVLLKVKNQVANFKRDVGSRADAFLGKRILKLLVDHLKRNLRKNKHGRIQASRKLLRRELKMIQKDLEQLDRYAISKE